METLATQATLTGEVFVLHFILPAVLSALDLQGLHHVLDLYPVLILVTNWICLLLSGTHFHNQVLASC